MYGTVQTLKIKLFKKIVLRLKKYNTPIIQLACYMKYFQLFETEKIFTQGPKKYELKLKVFYLIIFLQITDIE